jgi:hypothetical protein
MNGWSPKEQLNPSVAHVAASQTNQAVSNNFPIFSGAGLKGMVIKLKFSAVTVASGITAKLQTAIDGGWVDSKTVAVVSTADAYIKLNNAASADQTYFPLLAGGRIVISTGAGDSVTVSSVKILQEI